jgi:hypothetical protein
MMQMNVQPFTVDWYEAYKTAFDAVDIKNADRILIKLPPQQPQIPGIGTAGMAIQQQQQQPPGQLPMPGEMQQLQSVPYGGK